jgi:uncharacterized protein (TIGR02145 family)
MNKPVSTATLTALGLKAPLANPVFTGTVLGIDKTMVGLSNVDNTTDMNKPVSTATLTALGLKAPLANPVFTGTVLGIDKTMVGLSNVDNTSDVNKPVSSATQTALDLKENASNKSDASLGTSTILYPTQNAVKTYVDSQVATGAPDATSSVKGKIQLTGELGGSASSPTVPGLALKAPINNPAFTGTVTGVTKSMVGLGNVDNTTDAGKPVSTATQTALDLKLNRSDFPTGTNTGNILYWNGTIWVNLAPGLPGQVIFMSSTGIPIWSSAAELFLPGAPTSVVATAGNTSASVAFVAPRYNGGSAITGYTVTSGPGNISVSGTTSPINVTGLTNGTAYTFTVVATNSVGSSVASAASTAVTPSTVPSAPTSVVATAGNSSASVAFVAPTNNGGSALTGYTVTSNPNGITAFGSTSPINVTGLTNGTAYTFTVVATNSVGSSVASSASTAVTPATVPSAPTAAVATAGNSSASVAFVAPTNNGGSAITGYTVTSNPGNISVSGTTSPINLTGLTNGTSYTFTVVATNAVGSSVASSASTAVTPATVPSAPTAAVATAGNSSASVAFVAPTNNGGSAITGYTVTSSPSNISVSGTTSPINVTGLTNGTSYTFTVVATNSVGSSVASTVSSAVIPFFLCGTNTVSDIDGNAYNTVLIGTQCWTKENLKTSRYRNGGLIPNVTDGTAWINLTTGAWSYYNNDVSNNAIYGKLYNWYTTLGDTLCPTGWGVPTDAEWTILTTYLGGESVAGGKMKSVGTAYWNTPNTGATNESGFSALPGGYRNNFGGSFSGSFSNIRIDAFFWSATENVSSHAWLRNLFNDYGDVDRNHDFNKSVGASVRCLRD